MCTKRLVSLVWILLIVAAASPSKATGQTLAWITSIGGEEGGYGKAFDVARDGSGNVYLAGSFYLNADFDGDGITDATDAGQGDGFLAKYNGAGVLQWVVGLGSASVDQARGVAVDAAGNAFVTGYIEGDADFSGDGSPDVIATSFLQFFLARYDTDGAFQWVRSVCGLGEDVALGGTDDIFIAGQLSACADFEGDGTPDISGAGPFLASYDRDGTFKWFRYSNGGVGETATAVGTEVAGHVYYAGSFFGGADFDGDGVEETFSGEFASSAFIAKYDAEGDFQWVRTAGSLTEDARAFDLAVTPDGTSFVVGTFAGAADFDEDGTADVPNSTFGNAFLVSYDASGAMQWVRAPGGTSVDEGRAVATGGGSVYLGGYFIGSTDLDGDGIEDAANVILARYDANGGVLGAVSGSGNNPDEIAGIAVDENGDLFVAGVYTVEMDLDGDGALDVSSERGSFEAFAAKLLADGALSNDAARPGSGHALLRGQNYPNPFRHSTTIRFAVQESATVTLSIYDVTGRRLGVLVDQYMTPGEYEHVWEAGIGGRGEAVGVYFYHLTVRGETTRGAMMRVK